MAFKENYLDEIADRKYQLIDSRTGAVIYPAVKMERVDTPTQVGDKFGSKILNSIFNFMNGLLNGTVTVKNATNASAVPWSGVSGKPSTYAPSSHSHAFSAITGKPSTYAPTLGETSTTAYRGDKGKVNAIDIANIKSGTTAVGNASKFGGQLPAYYAKTSQFEAIKKIKYGGININTGGKNYFSIGLNANERLIPVYINTNALVIDKTQYTETSITVYLTSSPSFNFGFYYILVYI